MIRHRWLSSVAPALVACMAGAPLQAQEYTLGDLAARVHTADSIVSFATREPAFHQYLMRFEEALRVNEAGAITLRQAADVFSGKLDDPWFWTILRTNREKFSKEQLATIVIALDTTLQITNVLLIPPLDSAVGQARRKALLAPKDSFDLYLAGHALDLNKERLRRFSVKYGPDSPHLNLAEAGLNYLGQLVLPGVFLRTDGGPSPAELVATYRTTDFTDAAAPGSGTHLRMVTSAQLGMRFYNFSKTGCGQSSAVVNMLLPCYMSIGGFMMTEKDAPLQFREFFTQGQRGGIYVALSKYHVGYLFQADKRLVFGIDTQVLPYIF